MAYRFGLLRLDISAEADAHNAQWLGPMTLGIEITCKPLMRACGLGNNDPQHPHGISSAIEDALEYPMPPDGAKIVTQRLDKDALGAMSIFYLRQRGMGVGIDSRLVAWIGAIDRLGYNNACAECPGLAREFAHKQSTSSAMNVISHDNGRWKTIDSKVIEIARILVGAIGETELHQIASLRRRLEKHSFKPYKIYGNAILVRAPGKLREARQWANSRSQVAVISDTAFDGGINGTSRRWSVIAKTDIFDRTGFEREANILEASKRGISVSDLENLGLDCGGNQNIISSPEGAGRDSYISDEELLELVIAHTKSGTTV
ncbi:hypothetical protein KW796_01660 [Candidatus Parcubacteria bacterium]|nr:hypothetical protein [Candidatus Parcubacteria bacterium]